MEWTGHARTVDALLKTDGVSLAEFLSTGRSEGLSYDKLSRRLEKLTDGAVVVTGVTLRNWWLELDPVAAGQ